MARAILFIHGGCEGDLAAGLPVAPEALAPVLTEFFAMK